MPSDHQEAPEGKPQGMVACSQVTAVNAGLHILNQGGNAVDAALATAACLTVVEPCQNGLGGDCFALVWDGKMLHGLNASGRSSSGWTADRFAGKDNMPIKGWESVTIPGQIAGWRAILDRFGSCSMERCLEPAIDAASNGFTVTPIVAKSWASGLETHGHSQPFSDTFSVNGQAPDAGSIFTLPDHAKTLRRIAESNGDDFYFGGLAERIIREAQAGGSCLSADDLASCEVEWVSPISLNACGVTGHEIPPNGQGIAALAACGIAEHLELDRYELDAPQAVHLQVEALKQAFADLTAEVADPASMRMSPEALISPDRLKARATLIDHDLAGPMKASLPSSPGTVLLTTADSEGRMVAFIQSNFKGFGSGVVIPGTGIAMQNRGYGFVTTPGHPNQVGPRKRPFHSIIPGFWTKDGHPLGPFGCMGGDMQAQGHLQLWQRLFRWGQDPQAAINAKRWRLQNDGTLFLEEGFSSSTKDYLSKLGHRVESAPASHFGGAQMILRQEDGSYIGATDLRKDGAVGVTSNSVDSKHQG
jgi:gamma-glutamyltranspeptidase / glutathione hydrolase